MLGEINVLTQAILNIEIEGDRNDNDDNNIDMEVSSPPPKKRKQN